MEVLFGIQKCAAFIDLFLQPALRAYRQRVVLVINKNSSADLALDTTTPAWPREGTPPAGPWKPGLVGRRRGLATLWMVASLLWVAPQGRSDVTNGLVAYYSFEGLSGRFGETILDRSGRGHHGFYRLNPATLKAPVLVAGPVGLGDALHFDGASYIEIPNHPDFNLSASITVAAWVSVDAFTEDWQTVFCRGDWSWRLHRRGASDNAAFHLSGLSSGYGVDGLATSLRSPKRWLHLAGTYQNGAGARLYVNGVLEASDPASTGLISTSGSDPVTIGGQLNYGSLRRLWRGQIDEVRLYNRALSPAEVAEVYQLVFPEANGRPALSPPADQVWIEAPQSLSLRAQVRDDGLPLPADVANPDPADPHKLRWGWAVVSAPAASAGVGWSGAPTNGEAFTCAGSANPPGTLFTCEPTATFDVPGLYVLEFSASDGEKTARSQIKVWIQSPTSSLDPTRDKILYVVATAHLDTQWNWTIQDTINSYIPSTLSANFDFFNRYLNYTFSFEGSFRYRLAKEYYPAEYLTLSNYIAQGRWRVTGSAVDACDVNIPSPESLIRHALYGNTFWKREFGKTSADIFLPDCFGFGYALPSVAAHCGLKGFSSVRAWTDMLIPKPFTNVGRWLGPDGASIVVGLPHEWYTSTIGANLANDSDWYNRVLNQHAVSGLYLGYKYFGTGDIGGGPTEASVNWLEQSVNTTNGLIKVVSAGADQMFRDLTPSQASQLPGYQGELLGTLGSGSYTTHPELKRYNRQNEQRADAAERISVMADWLQGGATYPQERLNQAWERFLWHQFHDDICGTSIPAAYPFTWNDDLISLNEFGAIETAGAGVLAGALDTTAAGVPLLVYNPLSIPREDVVEAMVSFPGGAPAAVRVFDPVGSEVPSQMGPPAGNRVPVTFLATVPATGVAVYDVRPSATPCPLNTGLSVSSSQLENSRYLVQLNANGDVSSIFDKLNSRPLLSSPIRWDFLADSGSAWTMDYSAVASAPVSYLGGPARFEVLENGPARVCLAVTRANAGSTFTERIRLGAGAGGDRVEWDVTANWRTLRTLLKVEFPLAVTNSSATFDLGLGTVRRGNANSSIYEVPAQQWADLTGADGAYGVTIMNDCRIGWDKPNNTTLRLTIFHNPAMGSENGYQATNGIGSHRLTFAVLGHRNSWDSAGSPWAAARLNQPLQTFQTLAHPGRLGKSFSFLSCNNSNVMVKAVKKAESSNEIVVRLQELSGRPQTAQLSFARPILTARRVTGAEEPLGSLSPSGGTLTLSLGAYQPMTIALTLAAPDTLLPTVVSAPVVLPFNLDAVSTDGNRADGNFDNGYAYPAELMPASIVRDGVIFRPGPTNDGANNALICQGQTITFNGADYDHLYLLAAAAGSNTVGTFTIQPGGSATNLTVPFFAGFFGQWFPPSVLPDQEIGWVCTHRHDSAGRNNAYNFCYLFKYGLALSSNATALVLPNAPNLRIFAITLARHTAPETVAAGGPLAQPPLLWANAGPSRTVNALTTNGPAVVTLDGSASADPDGAILSYAWSMNGAPLASGVRPVVNLPLGTNTIFLAVTDEQGQTAIDTTTILVLPPLTLSVSATPMNAPAAPLTVRFSTQTSGGGLSDSTDDHRGTATAQGENSGSGEVARNAFDNITGTKWLDFASAYPSTRSSWIQYQYANGLQYVVTSYTLTTANDAAGYPGRNPANWRLLGSTNGGASWTTLDTQINQVFSASYQKRTYAVTYPGAYNLYRLQIDRVANASQANSVQLDELEFMATPPPYSYWWSFGDGTTSTLQNPQHTYADTGTYTATCAAGYGMYSGTNTVTIIIGPLLSAALTATPTNGAAPLTVQFTGLAGGGRSNPPLTDTTDNHLGTITAQGEYTAAGEIAANAFDNFTGTKWLDFASAYPSTRSTWIQYQYANGLQHVVTGYSLTTANDAGSYPGRNPANWRLLGCNNGGASWTTLDTQVNQVFYSSYQKRTYPVTNPGAYNLYRFQIDRVADPTIGCLQLDELEFLAQPPFYWWSFGDGATATAQNPQHTYTNSGTYAVTLVVSDGLSTATNSLLLTFAASPALVILSREAETLALGWPGGATDYHLYAATNLAPPIAWSPVTNAVMLLNGTNSVNVPIGPGNRFFQLRNP